MLGVLEQAEALDDPAARAALLTFVIVGGGPTGVEMAGALAEFRRHVVPRDYRNVEPHAVRIVLLEAGPELLSPFVPHLRARARRDLLECGVEVRTGAKVTRITEERVELASGEPIAARTAIWAAGIRAAPVSASLGLPTGRSGCVRVEPTLRVPGYPHVFAAGDVALIDGAERLPQFPLLAVNERYAPRDRALREGDTVAIIPPVAGG